MAFREDGWLAEVRAYDLAADLIGALSVGLVAVVEVEDDFGGALEDALDVVLGMIFAGVGAGRR